MDIQRRYQIAKATSDVLFKLATCMSSRIDLNETLQAMGYKKIAVYGFGRIGVLFTRMLMDGNVKIDYVVDRNKKLCCDYFDLRHSISDIKEETELIIITTIAGQKEIKKEIADVSAVNTIGINDFLNEVLLFPQKP